MTSTHIRITALLLSVAALLAGCDTLDGLFDRKANTQKVVGDRIAIIPPDPELAADARLQSTPVTLPAPVNPAEWTQPGGSSDNVIPNLNISGPLEEVCSRSVGKGSDSSSHVVATPVIGGGMVFTVDASSEVRAFDAAKGSRIWDEDITPEDADDSDKGAGGGLAYADGRLFVSSGFGFVKAMDAKTGKTVWTTPTEVPVRSAPAVKDGRVFVITQENQLIVLDAMDGHQLWDHRGGDEPAGILASTSVAISENNVIVPYSSGEIYSLAADTGRENWNDVLSRQGNVTALTVLNDIAGRPVLDRDMVFVINQSGTMAAISTRTGARVWSRNIAGIQTPVPAGDFVFIVSNDGKVLCFSRAEGRVKWTKQLPAFDDPDDQEGPIVWVGPVLVGGRLALMSSQGNGVLLNPETGEQTGTFDIPDGTYISPASANGILYVLTNGGDLVALR